MVGLAVGLRGFIQYARHSASVQNDLMLGLVGAHLAQGADGKAMAVAQGPVMFSAFTLFAFLLTPFGLWSTYLVTSGAVRAVSAMVDDPRGDPVLSGLHWALASAFSATRRRRRERSRERREGPEVPDVLVTGANAGLLADFVVVASRRKPEWTAGAIILTGEDWYRLGPPVEAELENGLRMLYPLTRLETVEVVRRGIEYALPRLSKRPLRPEGRPIR